MNRNAIPAVAGAAALILGLAACSPSGWETDVRAAVADEIAADPTFDEGCREMQDLGMDADDISQLLLSSMDTGSDFANEMAIQSAVDEMGLDITVPEGVTAAEFLDVVIDETFANCG